MKVSPEERKRLCTCEIKLFNNNECRFMITAAKCAEVSLWLNRPAQQTPTNTKDEKSTTPHAKVMLRSSPTIKGWQK